MRQSTLRIWVLRLIFCICVILAYNMLNNFGAILSWFDRMLSVFTPFIIGGIISFLLFPICKKLEALLLKTNKNFIMKRVRVISTLTIIFFVALFVILLLTLICPIIYEGILSFVQAVPKYLNDIYFFIDNLTHDAGPLSNVMASLKNVVSLDNITKMFISLDYNSYVGGITSLFFGIFNILIGAIISIYLLLDRSFIKQTAIRIARVMLDDVVLSRTGRLCKKISKVIYTFIFGQVIDAFMVSCFIYMFLTIFGIDNSVILAIFYFIFAVIPYFGSIIGVVCVAILSLLSGNINQLIIATIIAIVLQQVDANFISPKIVGKAVGIGPLYVILGITLFGGIFGIWGLFLGPPLMAIFMELLDDFVSSQENKMKNKSECLRGLGIFSKIKDTVSKEKTSNNASENK